MGILRHPIIMPDDFRPGAAAFLHQAMLIIANAGVIFEIQLHLIRVPFRKEVIVYGFFILLIYCLG